ncbi:baseplate hub protein [Pseudomonas panipatensis]|uniref:baseplate hub protein n=1 Tax=Pseudomonas panipatensis TaxID=428992 RepID=UPI0035B20D62
MPFINREIQISFQLAEAKTKEQDGGKLNAHGDNVVNLQNHRCQVIIENSGGNLSMGCMQLRVYGMKESDMNHFSTPVGRLGVRNDTIRLSAGDVKTGLHQVFEGTIGSAVVNYNGLPDVAFDVYAQSGLFEQIAPTAANSYRGDTDVATILEALAKKAGLAFRNYGVNIKLSNPNLPGTLIDQIRSVTEAACIPSSLENGVLSIWPNDGGTDAPAIELAPHTGLVGYPSVTAYGIKVVTEFNPALHLGAKVHLSSNVPKTRGTWRVQNMRHELATETLGGQWFTTVMLAEPGFYVSKW